MDGEDHYDEYGNYIGPDLDTSSDEGSGQEDGYGNSDEARSGGLGAAASFAADMIQRDNIDGPLVRMDLTVVDSDASVQQAPPSNSYGVGSNAIVLTEDKQYYPDASEVYGEDVETLVEEEDAQPLSVPIVAPIKQRKTTTLEEDVPQTTYSPAFMAGLLAHPQLARNVAVVGHIHSGKTSLLDMLVEQTHVDYKSTWPLEKQRRWTDTRVDEQSRGISIKSTPVSLVLPTCRGKSYLVNTIDCPGHANFCAETTAALRASDGCVVVVDACEGIMMQTERVIREAVVNELSICLVVSKMDRLITELKLPPNDAYFKLRYMIGRVNEIIAESYSDHKNLQTMRLQSRGEDGARVQGTSGPSMLSPELGNVCFASGRDRWCFTLESFAYRVYSKQGQSRAKRRRRTNGGASADAADPSALHQDDIGPKSRSSVSNYEAFAKNLWGDRYYDASTGKIVKKQPSGSSSKRTFVQFVLEPLWKLYGQILGENTKSLRTSLERSLRLSFGARELEIDPQPLLRLVLRRWMGEPAGAGGVSGAAGFVGMLAQHIPSPVENAYRKVRLSYAGSDAVSSERSEALLDTMYSCDSNGPLMINIVKLYPVEETGTEGMSRDDGSGAVSGDTPFLAFGRVFSGTIRPGQEVRVLGEHYSEHDDLEDVTTATVTSVAICQGRYHLEVDQGPAGCWVMLGGIDSSISHTATICDSLSKADTSHNDMDDFSNSDYIQATFRPLQHMTKPVIRVSLEPRNPAELPRMVSALRVICKSYPLLRSRVEESGEHVLLGTGEMHLDCALHDLRSANSTSVDGGIEIKLSDPVVSFCETVSKSSSFPCTTETPNEKNRITAVAEPLERKLYSWTT